MSLLQALLLGIVQGLTEFIPVSSSGHLLLTHHAFGINETGLAFDVALHIGTLVALLIFFYKDVLQLLEALFVKNEKTKLAWVLIAATLPAVVAGYVLNDRAETTFRSPWLVIVTLALVGLLMLAAERYSKRRTRHMKLHEVGFFQGLSIGLAQAVALVPGVSRSGSTIVMGLFAGLDRVAATRFSFLLSMPITLGAIVKVLSDGDTLTAVRNDSGIFTVGIIAACLSGIVAIRFLLKFVAKHSLNIFAYYRLTLAGLVFLAVILF